ncbi:Huntingtin [Frankliniella fusca]|uniref:Huntingtin n=1 Tax=Frankliniella fusca TaxID=407009 RepID=A0AAE1HYT9_9NEOP|nr:Huntingtin [Frankliniella fusca]
MEATEITLFRLALRISMDRLGESEETDETDVAGDRIGEVFGDFEGDVGGDLTRNGEEAVPFHSEMDVHDDDSKGIVYTWVVLHCAQDDSHVLVSNESVVYADELSVGDEVQFSYPGYKDLLPGTIKAFSDDYGAMRKVLNKLNSETKPRRETSFHVGVPRKAKQKVLAELSQRSSRKATKDNSKSAATPESTAGFCEVTKVPTPTPAGDIRKSKPIDSNESSASSKSQDSDANDDTDSMLGNFSFNEGKTMKPSSDVSDSNSDEPLVNYHEKQKLKQVSKLNKEKDIRKLKDFAGIFRPDGKQDKQNSSLPFGKSHSRKTSSPSDGSFERYSKETEKKQQNSSKTVDWKAIAETSKFDSGAVTVRTFNLAKKG